MTPIMEQKPNVSLSLGVQLAFLVYLAPFAGEMFRIFLSEDTTQQFYSYEANEILRKQPKANH
jgi:hypothetical protein